ncbi:hypothetical protein [Kitasatospora sp. McL0602]|uniref:hypothetical protein n=1 Tax=Kitasatospora sp. McL0602 TaxID=3439530 RepID=UPI003F8BCE65
MADLPTEAARSLPEDYPTARIAFAQELTGLWNGCGRPTLRGDIAKETGLAASVISDAISGKYLPKRDNLLAIVRALYEHETGQPLDDTDERLRRWRSRWEEVSRLQIEYRRTYGSLRQPPPRVRPPARDARALPSSATLLELEAAKGEVQEQLSEIGDQETATSHELLAAIAVRDGVKDAIDRLAQQLAQERSDKDRLRREITALEQERNDLNQRIFHLNQELLLMREEKLGLTQEESTLNDRRAELYFAWARSEENAATVRQLNDRIQLLTAQIADSERRRLAADQLIRTLLPPRPGGR